MSVVGSIIVLRKKERTMEITLEKLMELRVLRPSMFDRDGTWFVIYTENGPMDITLFDLTGDVSGQ